MSNRQIKRGSNIRNRRRERGATMVESAIILPLLADFLILMQYAHNEYDLKLTTLHEAREHAWSYALEGCKSGRDDRSYAPKYFTIDGTNSAEAGDAVGSASATSATVLGTANAVRGVKTLTRRTSSTTTVYCNPPLGPKLKLQSVIDNFFSH